VPEKSGFDLRVSSALPASAVLKLHTEGEPTFQDVGRNYPSGFIDVDIGRWEELTGESG
jgi:hypothetical protein